MGVPGSMSVCSSDKYFRHQEKSSEIHVQQYLLVPPWQGPLFIPGRASGIYFFQLHMPALPSHWPLQITSLPRDVDLPPEKQTSLFDRQWREENKVHFLKLFGKTWGISGHKKEWAKRKWRNRKHLRWSSPGLWEPGKGARRSRQKQKNFAWKRGG